MSLATRLGDSVRAQWGCLYGPIAEPLGETFGIFAGLVDARFEKFDDIEVASNASAILWRGGEAGEALF